MLESHNPCSPVKGGKRIPAWEMRTWLERHKLEWSCYCARQTDEACPALIQQWTFNSYYLLVCHNEPSRCSMKSKFLIIPAQEY